MAGPTAITEADRVRIQGGCSLRFGAARNSPSIGH